LWLLSKKVNVPITKKCVLGSKTVDCFFLVYDIHNVGYKTFIEKYEVPIILGTIIESRDVTFFENIFSIRDETSPSKQEFIEDDISITTTERTAPIVERKHMIRATMKFLVMVSLYTSLMTHLEPLKSHIHLLMLVIVRKS
jgi:hypothetical protein